ncbi:MAG: tetratricopeptide repeat protein [Deltaproteobacteria bacterium]
MKKLILASAVLCAAFTIACSESPSKKEGNIETKSDISAPKTEETNIETDTIIKFYLNRIKVDPNDYFNYNKLGEVYIQKARETGDISYYDTAEASFKEALALFPDNYFANVYLGQIKISKHDFAAALPFARKSIELKPEDSYGYGILGDVHINLGQYGEAKAAYEKMASIQQNYNSLIRLSHINELYGRADEAVRYMSQAAEQGAIQALTREYRAWVEYALGELYFNSGRLKEAEERYKSSLAIQQRYHYALSGLAKVRATEGNYTEAIELYKEAIDVVPLPLFAASLGDVYKKSGNANEAQKQYDLVEYIGLLSKVNEVLYNRELALFYADHDIKLDEALSLAERELEARRDIYTYDTLAWVLYKNGKFKEALSHSNEALKLGTKDASLYFHAGMINLRLGNAAGAQELLKRALAINPHFHIIHSEEAKNALRELSK